MSETEEGGIVSKSIASRSYPWCAIAFSPLSRTLVFEAAVRWYRTKSQANVSAFTRFGPKRYIIGKATF